jgi:hypothetical protein
MGDLEDRFGPFLLVSCATVFALGHLIKWFIA